MYQAQEVVFDTPDQELAITGSDQDIYPKLSITKQGRQTSEDSEALCFNIRVFPESQQPDFIRRPEGLPFTSSGVQDFISTGLPLVRGRWSIRWSSDKKNRNEKLHDDGFRAVFVFRTLEFSLRPVPVQEGPGPKRVLLSTEDIERCLRAALRSTPGEEMRAVIGKASVDVFEDKKKTEAVTVTFQWRIDRAEEAKVKREVRSWRVTQFGKSNPGAYEQKKNEYNFYHKVADARQNNPSARDTAGAQPDPFPLPFNPAASSHRDLGGYSSGQKRPGSRSGTPGPSGHKRRSTDMPDLSRSSSSLLASSSTMYPQGPAPRLPGPAGMISGARPSGTGFPSGPSPYGHMPPIGPAGPSTGGSASSQPTVTTVTREMSNVAITAPAPRASSQGQNVPPPPPPPPLTNYRGNPLPMPTFRGASAQGGRGAPAPQGGGGYPSTNQPAYGQGYQPPAPSQGYPPQGSMPAVQYNTPPYYQGNTGGNNPQGRGGYPTQSPYQGAAPAGSQSGRGDSSRRDDPRGGGQSGSKGSGSKGSGSKGSGSKGSGSKHSHHHKGGSGRR